MEGQKLPPPRIELGIFAFNLCQEWYTSATRYHCAMAAYTMYVTQAGVICDYININKMDRPSFRLLGFSAYGYVAPTTSTVR